jgi:Fe-S cluster assembly iron-binding protein IscA
LGLALDKPKEDEMPTKIDGLDFLISEVVEDIADGSLVDYISSTYGEEFILRAGSAGC